jgi:hypothetical protein
MLLSSFSAEDWIKCTKYLKARKLDSKELRLFKFLKNNQKKLDSDKVSIDNLKNSSLLGYNTKKNVQNIMSRLSLLIEDYMVMESFNQDQIEKEFRLFRCYNDRGLFSLANKKADSLIKLWQENSPIGRIYFEYILKIFHNQYFSNNPIKSDTKVMLVKKLFQALLGLYEANMELYNYAAKSDITIKLIDEDDLKNINLSTNYLNDSYFTLTKHLNNQDSLNTDSFEYLYSELLANNQINIELKAIVFSHCEIYLRKKIQLSSKDDYGLKLLDLYEYGVKSKILTYKDKIASVKFQNIIQIACYVKQFDWAESFQSNYGHLVAKEHVGENKLMTMVQVSFGKHEYDKVIGIILFNDFKVFLFKVNCRWLLLSTYFITFDSIDFFESQLTNFTQFFYYNKSKLSNINFERSLNLAKIFRAYITKPNFSLEQVVSKYEHITFKTRLPGFIEERKRYIKENGIEL